MMDKGRLIFDAPAEGAWNMAVDQALLATAEETGQASLRFYAWSRPTLSLGYFQRFADREQHPPSLNCDLVRRASGGGAIIHHHEITYSLSVPSSNRWSSTNGELYNTVHRAVIEQLSHSNIEAHLHVSTEQDRKDTSAESSAFLCFHRRATGDILIGINKVGGSAQRRLKNSLIQHGSLLLTASEFAPELTGINDLTGNAIDQTQFCHQLANLLSRQFSFEWVDSQLSKDELHFATSVKNDRFAQPNWTQKQ